jgi:hypothetical protein
MGDLMDIASRLHGAEEVGFEGVFGHGEAGLAGMTRVVFP